MKWQIEFRPTATIDFEVEADTEDEAVDKAWKLFMREIPAAEWDVHYVSDMEEEEDEDDL